MSKLDWKLQKVFSFPNLVWFLLKRILHAYLTVWLNYAPIKIVKFLYFLPQWQQAGLALCWRFWG